MDQKTAGAKPWRAHVASRHNAVPTMLSPEELSLLNWLTSAYYRGEGTIIDAGCFLGGSTFALTSGLAASHIRATIHSYDLFATGDAWDDVTFSRYGLVPNQSFLDRFQNHLAEYLPLVHVHAGNLLDQSWSREPIEILFLDICKTPQLHDYATSTWFPRLIPGRSILIQQDYGWRRYYWGNVMMEVFKDHFTILDDVAVSRVYLCTKAISEEAGRENIYAYLSGDEKLTHMQAALATMPDLAGRSHLLFSYAQLAHSLGRHDLVRDTLELMLSLQDQLAAVLGDPLRAAVTEFPHHFLGPDRLPLPARFKASLPEKPLVRLPFAKRIQREVNRVVSQIGLADRSRRRAA
jgi:hypothetical protein